MSVCYCGQVEIPLGLPMCNLNGTLHGVTACVDKDRWEERALEAEAAIARVRELHHLTVDTVDCREGGVEDIDHCAECGYIYVDAEPCPTIRAIEGEL